MSNKLWCDDIEAGTVLKAFRLAVKSETILLTYRSGVAGCNFKYEPQELHLSEEGSRSETLHICILQRYCLTR